MWQEKWVDFLGFTHQAMRSLKLQVVRTPSLLRATGLEPEIEAFETQLKPFLGGKGERRFLPTSPEIPMKQLLCQGFKNIYEIKQCFRNSEKGPLNHTEFYLLEWYRTHTPLSTLTEDLNTMIGFLSQKMGKDSFPAIQKFSMRHLFQKHLSFELRPDNTKQDFKAVLKKKSLPFKSSDTLSDLFHLLFLNGIEPYLPSGPLVIYNYPPFQKAYARLNKEGWALRFEFFWKGMELANAFDEVRDFEEQKARFEAENKVRRQQKKPARPVPQALLNGMKKTPLPPCVGIALGLERLFMALTGLKNIHSLINSPD